MFIFIETIDKIRKYAVQQLANASKRIWIKYVREQLSLGCVVVATYRSGMCRVRV